MLCIESVSAYVNSAEHARTQILPCQPLYPAHLVEYVQQYTMQLFLPVGGMIIIDELHEPRESSLLLQHYKRLFVGSAIVKQRSCQYM